MNQNKKAPRSSSGEGNLIETVIPLIEARNFFSSICTFLLNWGLVNSAIWGSFVLKDGKKILSKLGYGGLPAIMIIVGFSLATITIISGFIAYKLRAWAVALASTVFIAAGFVNLFFSVNINRWLKSYSLSVPHYWIWLVAIVGSLQGIWGISLLISRKKIVKKDIPDSKELEKKNKSIYRLPGDPGKGIFSFAVSVPGKRVHMYKAVLLPERMVSIREDLGNFIVIDRHSSGQWEYLGRDLELGQVSGGREYAIKAVDNQGKFVDMFVDESAFAHLKRWTEIP